MKKVDLARELARETGESNAQAADRIDHVIHEIVANLRKGQSAELAGLGEFQPGENGALRFEQETKASQKSGVQQLNQARASLTELRNQSRGTGAGDNRKRNG